MIPLDEIKQTLITSGKYWITFTGDSITSCEWVHPNWRDIVLYVLQNELTDLLDGNWKLSEWGVRGFNFAYDGATTKDILDRLDDTLLVRPQLVVSLMGGNDPALGIKVDESVQNIEMIIDRMINEGSKVVWSNSIPAGKGSRKNSEYAPYAQAFIEIPDKNNFHKINMFEIYKKFDTDRFFTFLSEENPVEGVRSGEIDLHHPNQLGNAYIAKVILKEVFQIEFDPEKYIKDTLAGEKYPRY